jgi:uncharacterized protein YbjT (DUF2867 family)
MFDAKPDGRHILLAGATGLVGTQILKLLLADGGVSQVHVLSRRALDITHPKLRVSVVDFRNLPALDPVDEVYLALATTEKDAGSREAFRAVDFDANLAVAKAGFDAGARRAAAITAIGANARSSSFYLRVKGELEDALGRLGLEALVIARPSLLLGNRDALQQRPRPFERIAEPVMAVLGLILPRRYRSIRDRDVAGALVAALPAARGTQVLFPDDMMRIVNTGR